MPMKQGELPVAEQSECPQVLHATRKGTQRPSTWVLELSQPRFSAGSSNLTFTVKVPPRASRMEGPQACLVESRVCLCTPGAQRHG